MIRAFIQCKVGHDVDAIEAAFDFEALPRERDVIVIYHADYLQEVRVRRVVHHVIADPDGFKPAHPVVIECDYEASWEIGDEIK